MLHRDPQVLDHGVLHRARNTGIKVDVLGAQKVPCAHPIVGFGYNIIQMLLTDAISKKWESAAIMREQKANVGHSLK